MRKTIEMPIISLESRSIKIEQNDSFGKSMFVYRQSFKDVRNE